MDEVLNFVYKEFEDSTLGTLRVERWSDGEILFRSTGASDAVVLSNQQKAELVAFILGEDA